MDGEQCTLGRFRLDLGRRALLRDEKPVRLGSRALDILCILASSEGRVVSKDELMARVWPGTVVEENNIQVHISALRRVLAEEETGRTCLVTVPGRGYRLIGVQPGSQTDARISDDACGPPLPNRPSLAVLPFANLSGDPDQEYFAEGMVEEIITALSRIRWLFVIARNSSSTYKGESIDLRQVGRELGVHYLLEGSVRKARQRVRISVRLIDSLSGAHIWSDRFDGALDEIFELQDRVASSVAGVIEPTLQAAEIRRSAAQPTNDITAYDLYLRALALMFTWESNGIFRALDLLEQAMERDARYGAALAEAAFCHFTIHVNGWSDDLEITRLKGTELAQRALQVAGDNANVLCLAAYTLAYFGEEIDVSIALLNRGLELNPNHARAWQWGGWLQSWAGQPTLAIEHFERSLHLNPREQRANPFMGIGVAHFFAQRFDESRTKLRQSLREKPNWAPTYRFLAACCAHMGRLDEAQEAVKQLRNLTNTVMPNVAHWRNPEDRELYLSGLRLALGET